MSDLDARIAALMRKAAYLRYAPIEVADKKIMEFEQAIRVELQKPSLHEAVSDQETIDAIRACHLKVRTESMIDMRSTLESFLQGRAKPATECQHKVFSHFGDQKLRRCVNCGIQETAQEEITDAEILTAAGDWAVSLMGPVHLLRICRQVFNFRASKGEKT